MATSKREQGTFPRFGMDYQDRFRMTVKEFGRVVLIELNRGTAKVSEEGKTVTITYSDSATRKVGSKAKKQIKKT